MNRPFDVTRAGFGLPSLTGEAAERSRPQLENGIFIACGLAWASGLIHIEAAVAHLDEYVLFAVFFVVLAVLQFVWGAAVCRRPTPRLLRVGASASVLVACLWLMSRTTGLPLGPEPWKPEPVGAFDSIATADEFVTAILIWFPLGLGHGNLLQRGTRFGAVAGGLCLILVSSLLLVSGTHVH